MANLWGGRFKEKTDPVVERFTSSIETDWVLAPYDVEGSIAHAKMLGRCGIIPRAASRRLVQGLTGILRDILRGRWKRDPRAEDIHTQIQQMLERRIGPTARALHTARSRNDQVSLDLRLWCREAVTRLTGDLRDAQRALVRLARAWQGVVIPGYTHLQRAQPVLVAHHLLAYVEMLERDVERLRDARARLEVLPLGAAALAGSSLPIDRRYVAKLLGFPRVAANSLDAVSDRDFVLELLAALAIVGMHLSRLSEDIILWLTAEFGLLELDDAVATGSSFMPQKKNPDVLELIRGQAALLTGRLAAGLGMMKGLPLSYNRDLQWDKSLLFGAVDATGQSLRVLARLLGHVRLNREQARRLSVSETLCAADVAEYLVTRGVAFADAHRIVGALIAGMERQGRRVRDVSLQELRRFSPRFDRAAMSLFDPRRSVERKRSLGSTNPRLVQREVARWQRRLSMEHLTPHT
jgi:argininosuccinate lyase